MTGRNVNYLSDVATQRTNTAGELTPILEIDPEDGTMLSFLNRVAQGDASGIPMYGKLFDTNGNDLPVDTTVVLTAEQPGDARSTPVSVKEDNISPYINNSISNQPDADHIDSVKIELKGKAVNVRDVDTFYVEIQSSKAIDWSQGSELYFEREAVRETNLE